MTAKLELGAKIKQVRSFKQISIDDLVEKTGLSTELLEKIESCDVVPSLTLLILIARALGVRLGTFLDDTEQVGPVVNRSGKQDIGMRFSRQGAIDRDNMDFYPLATNKTGRGMEPFIIDIHPNVPANTSNHEGEEFIYVLKGQIEITYGKDVFLLEEGDTIYFDSIVEHCVSSSDNQTAKILAVLYTPY